MVTFKAVFNIFKLKSLSQFREKSKKECCKKRCHIRFKNAIFTFCCIFEVQSNLWVMTILLGTLKKRSLLKCLRGHYSSRCWQVVVNTSLTLLNMFWSTKVSTMVGVLGFFRKKSDNWKWQLAEEKSNDTICTF